MKYTLVLLLTFLCFISCSTKNKELKKRIIVATYDGGAIYLDQVDSMLNNEIQQHLKRETTDNLLFNSLLKKEAVKKNIQPELLLSEVMKRGYKLTNSANINLSTIQTEEIFKKYKDSLFYAYDVDIKLDSLMGSLLLFTDNQIYYRGNLNSKIELCVISDLQCPSCIEFEKEFTFLYHKYKNSVKFGSVLFSENSDISSLACEAAGKQYKFWEMHDFLIENHQTDLGDTIISNYAILLRLDMPKFKMDLSSEILKKKLMKQKDELITKGIWKVPTLVLNGEVLKDLPSIENLDRMLSKKLK